MKHTLKIALVVMLLLTVSAGSLMAQNTLRAFITIVDAKTEQPVPGAKFVMYVTQRPSSKWDKEADEQGVVKIAGFPPGMMTFEVTAEGYQSVKFSRRVRTSEPRLEFSISIEPIIREKGKADEKIAAQYAEASELMKKGNLKEALVVFEEMIEKYPDIKETYFSAAFAYKNLGQNQKALETLAKLQELDPTNADVLLMISEINLIEGNKEESDKYLKKALDLNPNDLYTIEKIAMAAYEAGNFSEAVKYYEMAVQIKPDNALPYYYLGNIYYVQDNFEKAIVNYENYIKYDPENSTGGITAAKEMLADAKARMEAAQQ